MSGPRGSGSFSLSQAIQRTRQVGLSRAVRAAVRLAGRVMAEKRERIWASRGGAAVDERGLAASLRANGDLSGILRHFRETWKDRFPLAPSDAPRLTAVLQDRAPDRVTQIVGAADALCAHRFDLLGSGPTNLGDLVDWHRDFKSGYRWDAKQFHADIQYGDIPGVDVKVPWELSRFQHLPTLGQAYWLTQDSRYAEEFVAQIRHWTRENPVPFGVNWACPMDVAIRAVNWLWGLAFFLGAPEVDDAFLASVLASLVAHGRHIARHLEIGADGITSNHYLANVTGLAYLALVLPEVRDAESWRRVGLEAVFREMDQQVTPDGVDYESSIPYHRLVSEMFLSVAILCRVSGAPIPPRFLERLGLMAEFTLAYTKPNGLAPQVGDADDGRLHILTGYPDWERRDHRHLLAVAGEVLDRDDLREAGAAAREEALWLCGRLQVTGGRPIGRAALPPSSAFPEAGIYILRGPRVHLTFTCGPVGTRGIGNHKHNDLLGFELNVDGEDVIVDPGNYLYTPDPVARNRFRSTAAHATVMVDGVEQNRLGEGSLFWLYVDAHPRCLVWESSAELDAVEAEHDGYARLTDPVRHRRRVQLDKARMSVAIMDLFEGSGRHEACWRFPLAPGCRVVQADVMAWDLVAGRARVRLVIEEAGLGLEAKVLSARVTDGAVSPRYGVVVAAPVLEWTAPFTTPARLRFRMSVL